MNRIEPKKVRSNTPVELRKCPQWVCWRVENREGKATKVPIVPGSRNRASSTSPAHWRPFEEAMAAFDAEPTLAGVGFVFREGDPFCGVDIDDCRNPDTGEIAPWAQAILDKLGTYSEISPSGTGVKIFLRATKPGRKCRKAYESGEVEIYDSRRFFTVTGEHVPGTPLTIEENQDALNHLYERVFGKPTTHPQDGHGQENATSAITPTADVSPIHTDAPPAPAALSDEEIIRLMCTTGKTKQKFDDLWNGRWTEPAYRYNSRSEADSSLVFKIAFFTKDASQIDRIFRRSGLFRDKWDEMRGDQSYGQLTIQRALEKVTGQYNVRKKRSSSKTSNASGNTGGTNPTHHPAGSLDPQSGRLILDTERTLPTAKAFVDEFYTKDRTISIKHYANIFFAWEDNRYAEIEDSTMKHKLLPWLTNALRARFDPISNQWTYHDFPANPRSVTAALDSIKAHTHLPAFMKPPLWLDGGQDKPDPRDILVCKTSLLHLPSMSHIPPTPNFLSFNALDYDPNPDAGKPSLWLDFLDQVFGDDIQSIELLQDWFGYCLTGDTSQQKMLLIVGPKRSGKGTIARVLTQLVGSGNVSGPTTSSLGGDFGLQPLIGKNIAIVSDARFSGDRIQTVIERLLCISGEDLLTVDRKHLPSVHLQLPTRFVFLTNEIPRLCDASGALTGRFMILRMTESFYGREDKTLTKKLTGELPAILNWAIEGWVRLRKRERFIQPESAGSVLEDMEHLSSPVTAFVQECCEVAPGNRCSVNVMYDAYSLWLAWDGVRNNPTKQIFGKNLQAAVTAVSVKRNHSEGRFYEGIDLTPEYRRILGENNRFDKGVKNPFLSISDDSTERSDPWEDIGFAR